jgi:hypothetical protein
MPGAIILMHENHGQTIRAMLGIFAAIERRHLHTVSVPRLLSDDPPSDSQVRAAAPAAGRCTDRAATAADSGDRVLDCAEPLDLNPHEISRFQEARRVHAHAHPTGRAGENQVTRGQRAGL